MIPFIAFFIFLFDIVWCAHVMNTPDEIRIIVFKMGSSRGLMGVIPFGGHIDPRVMSGARHSCRNVQNSLVNSITSDRINRIILIFVIEMILGEWFPSYRDSRIRSRHH